MKLISSTCLLMVLFSFSTLAQPKQVINSVDELPQHAYVLPANLASAIIENREYLNQLMAEIEKNILSDLNEYEILDNATLRDYYGDLYIIAFLKNDYSNVKTYIEKVRELSDKEAEKYLSGLVVEVLINEITQNPNIKQTDDAENIKSEVIRKLEGVDFSIIQESVESMKGRTEIYSLNYLNGILESQIQPVIDNNKGIVTLDIAGTIITFYYLYNYYLPIKDALNEAYTYMLNTYGIDEIKQDIWADRDVTLSNDDQLTPVVVGIWDTGVDMSVLPQNNRWTNEKESLNNIDDDSNGFIDDIHGIAYDMRGNLETELLLPEAQALKELNKVENDMKGYMDIIANISSEEASDMKKKFAELKPQEMDSLLQDLSLYSNYAHGTHVSGIAANGNPAAKILGARLTFDYRTFPFVPDETSAENWANMFKQVVNYFKENDVKVVNMSWTVGLDYEFLMPMETSGYGNSDEERMAQALKLFNIEKEAYIEAVESAPEILFICASGNDNNDVNFAGDFPASLDLPNILTVGAVDIEGKKTSFTTEGESVDIYANGYEVESYVPGGNRLEFSGTSMASPQVVNLAAKLWATYPDLTVTQVKECILNAATKTDENILLLNPAGSMDEASKY